MERLRQLIHEIHRRSLWQVLGIYLVASVAVLGGVATLGDYVLLPEWFLPLALGLLIVGLPVVLATAFVQEGGPGREAKDVATPTTDAPVLFTWRKTLVGGVLVFALLGVVAAALLLRAPAVAVDGLLSIAVLPLENLSLEEGNEFFTIGLQDEILTQLQKISDLHVISRSSVMRYQPGPDLKPIPEIGEEVGARWIVEGSVQRVAQEVRLNIQLIEAATNGHLWAESYEGDLSVQGILEFQGLVAHRIAESLHATIEPEEAEQIVAVPTENVEAYESYLVGRLALASASRNYAEGITALRGAVELDPDFAEAHAALARLLYRQFWFFGDIEDEHVPAGDAALARAQQLAPEGYETRLAEVYRTYWVELDYESALRLVHQRLEERPGDLAMGTALAFVERRLGRFEDAAVNLEASVAADPAQADFVVSLAETYGMLGRFDDAIRLWRRATVLEPDLSRNYAELVRRHLSKGDTAAARRVLDAVPEDVIEASSPTRARVMAYRGDVAGAIQRMGATGVLALQYLNVTGGADDARDVLVGDTTGLGDWYRRVLTYATRDDGAKNRRWSSGQFLGIAESYALLGDETSAVEALEAAQAVFPISLDKIDAPGAAVRAAHVYSVLGAAAEAVRALEAATQVRPAVTSHDLRLDPLWIPIRDDPAFQALIARLSAP